jgi:uncharacterized C2H2 Zn-finger protein
MNQRFIDFSHLTIMLAIGFLIGADSKSARINHDGIHPINIVISKERLKIMLNDRICILCDFNELDIIESQRENEEFRNCPKCHMPSFRRQIQHPSAVSMDAGHAIDQFDAERAKASAGHGNVSLRF